MREISLRQNGRFFFGWLVLLYSFVLMAIGYAGILSVSSIFVVPITEELGLSRSSLLLYTTVMMVSSVLFAKVYSWWLCRGSRMMMLIIIGNAVAVCLAYMGFSMATQLWQFYLCAILLGSGFSGLNTLPVSILITNWFGGSIKGTVMAVAFTGSGVGGMILAPVLNAVMEQSGWRQSYVVLGILFVAVLVPLTLLFARSLPEKLGFYKMGMTEGEVQLGSDMGISYAQAKKQPYFWMSMAAFFVMVLGSGALISNAAAYYVECGFSLSSAAAFTGYMSGMLIIGKLACGYLCDKKGVQVGMAVCFLLFVACFLQLFLLWWFPILIFGIVATYGFGCGAITTIPPLWVTGLFGERDYGTILGALTMAINLSCAIAGLLAGWMYDVTGSYSAYWGISAVGSMVATVLLLLAYRKRKSMGADAVT